MKIGKVSRDEILSGNLLRTILILSVPVIINSFLQSMYNLTDTFWLGKLGTEELAAINLVTPMQNLINNIGTGITVAGSVLVSQYLGAQEDEEAKSMANQIFACAMIFSVVCGLLCSVMAPAIVGWLGATGNTYYYGRIYLQLVMLDMPFLFTVNMYSSFRHAQGDTLTPMLLNLLGICINLVADPLLMVRFQMGAAGAALATIAAKAVPAVIAFIVLGYFFEHSKPEDRLTRFGIIIILSGTLGNAIDRILYGYVRDFIDIMIFGYDFPIFNVADICICIGVLFIFIEIFEEEYQQWKQSRLS